MLAAGLMLGFSKIVTMQELAKPQAIPGKDFPTTVIYLSGMALLFR